MNDIFRFAIALALLAAIFFFLSNMQSEKDDCIARGGEAVMSYPFGVACVEGR